MLRTASTIHSASCTSVFRASHGFDMLGVGYHQFKEAFQTSIHLHPIHSRALHAHVATLLLQQPGQPCQQIRCFIAERADLFASLSCLDTTQTHAPVSADARQCLRTVDTSPLYSCLPLLSLQCSSSLCAVTSQAVSVLLQCILRALLCGSGQ